MKLSIFKRASEKKSDTKRHRFADEIPAVLYGPRRKGEKIYLKSADIQGVIRRLKPGRLPTTLFELQLGNDTFKALVKEIQYRPTDYKILHIDFNVVEPDLRVRVNVPIICLGVAECAGIKLGGFLRHAIRSLKVSCMPDAIPEEFQIDVHNLQILDAVRLSDIPMPENVKPLGKMNEVAVVIAKR